MQCGTRVWLVKAVLYANQGFIKSDLTAGKPYSYCFIQFKSNPLGFWADLASGCFGLTYYWLYSDSKLVFVPFTVG